MPLRVAGDRAGDLTVYQLAVGGLSADEEDCCQRNDTEFHGNLARAIGGHDWRGIIVWTVGTSFMRFRATHRG